MFSIGKRVCFLIFFCFVSVMNVCAQGTLRIGMTASDIPLTTGQTDNGGEGMRFIGYTVYDALINWDLSSADKPSGLVPGLALSWGLAPSDSEQKHWLFRLRPNVRFHDGSLFTAGAVVWNLDKLLNRESPQFDQRQAAQGRSRIPAVATYRTVDPLTVEIVTKYPDATLPYQMAWIVMSSPAQWERLGGNWNAFAKAPSGTGPWKLVSFTPRERATLTPNADYWDKTRVPKLEKLVLLPLPDANARVAALRSGQVDWIEAPAPDTVNALKAANFVITSNVYPHNWTWHLSRLPGSPWNDERVRKAANLAIDREGMKELLNGLMIAAEGFVPPSDPWFGHPTFKPRFDPTEARRLLQEAGYSPDHPVEAKIVISTSGSGQMAPLTMNEFLQQNLAEVGIRVSFEVVDSAQLLNIWRAGAKDPSARGANGVNFTYLIQDPFTSFIRHLQCDLVPPNGTNWGYYCDHEMDALFSAVRTTFDEKKATTLMQKIHEKFVNEALFLMVAHDVGPRAMTKNVKGFVQARSWFQDFSKITVDNPS